MLWHFDELSEFARSGHGGFNATSDRGQIRPLRHVRVESVLPPTSDIDWRGRHGRKVPEAALVGRLLNDAYVSNNDAPTFGETNPSLRHAPYLTGCSNTVEKRRCHCKVAAKCSDHGL